MKEAGGEGKAGSWMTGWGCDGSCCKWVEVWVGYSVNEDVVWMWIWYGWRCSVKGVGYKQAGVNRGRVWMAIECEWLWGISRGGIWMRVGCEWKWGENRDECEQWWGVTRDEVHRWGRVWMGDVWMGVRCEQKLWEVMVYEHEWGMNRARCE